MHLKMILTAAMVTTLAAGCGVKLRATDAPGQVRLDKNAARIVHDDVAITLRQDKVPKRLGRGLMVMRIEVANFSAAPVRLSYPHMWLVDEDDLRRPAVDPKELTDALLKPYGQSAASFSQHAVADARGHMAVGVTTFRGHYYHSPTVVRYHYWGGYPGWYGDPYYDYDYDYYEAYNEYLEQRAKAMQFAQRLWDDRVVNPGSAEWGYVLFDFTPHDDDIIRFVVEVARWTDAEGKPLPLDSQEQYEVEIQPFEFVFRAD